MNHLYAIWYIAFAKMDTYSIMSWKWKDEIYNRVFIVANKYIVEWNFYSLIINIWVKFAVYLYLSELYLVHNTSNNALTNYQFEAEAYIWTRVFGEGLTAFITFSNDMLWAYKQWSTIIFWTAS